MCFTRMDTSLNAAYKQCLICEDSTGISKHYGGVCCSGCRGFFRRTVRFNRHYICAREGNCDTRKSLRNCCRACRYERCLKAGLNPLLVHSDRAVDKCNLSKRVKIQDEIEMPTSSPENNNEEVSALSKYEVITQSMQQVKSNFLSLTNDRKLFKSDGLALGYKNILEHLSSRDFNSVQNFFVLANRLCDDFFDNDNNHILACKSSYVYNLNVSVEEAFLLEPRSVSDRTKIDWTPRFFLNGNDFKKVWARMSTFYVDWASHIPELDLLDQDDKLNLIIGRCIPSIWLIYSYRSYLCRTKDCFPLSGGSYYPMSEDEQLLYTDPIISKFLKEMCTWMWDELVLTAREWQFTEAEFALLKVLCFVTSVPSLSPKGKKIIRESHAYYQSVLSNIVMNHPDCQNFDQYTKRLSALLMTLPVLEKASQIEDDNLSLMTLFNIGDMNGQLTYEFYVRRTGRT